MIHALRSKWYLSLCLSLFSMQVYTLISINNERNEEMNNATKSGTAQPPNRPQTPTGPFAYKQEEVFFDNKSAHVTLSGTLTVPQGSGPWPAVVLIAGMGPQDRDCTMMGHKLFLVLADYLTQRGIAVLRFDKRGIGKSTGTFSTSLTSQDFAYDVEAAVGYLKMRVDIEGHKIGLLGESEGAIIAPMVGAHSNNVAFLVLLAGAALTDVESVVKQIALQIRADGASEEIIIEDTNIWKQLLTIVITENNFENAAQKMRKAIEAYWLALPENLKQETEKLPFAINLVKADGFIAMFNSPWYRYFLNYNAVETLKKITVPTLALNGDTDFITSSRITLPVIAQALKEAGNRDYTILELPRMNHCFQECQTGSMAEYGAIEQTIAPRVLEIIAQWITEKTE